MVWEENKYCWGGSVLLVLICLDIENNQNFHFLGQNVVSHLLIAGLCCHGGWLWISAFQLT